MLNLYSFYSVEISISKIRMFFISVRVFYGYPKTESTVTLFCHPNGTGSQIIQAVVKCLKSLPILVTTGQSQASMASGTWVVHAGGSDYVKFDH